MEKFRLKMISRGQLVQPAAQVSASVKVQSALLEPFPAMLYKYLGTWTRQPLQATSSSAKHSC